MRQNTVVIRKYGNRRLYDTYASRYVNLDEVAGMVRKGGEVRVVDSKTGEDLTRVTLTQIIMEEASGARAGLPLELLRQLVISTDHAGQEFLAWYLRTAFDTYQKVQETVQHRLADMGTAAFAPIQRMREFLSGAIAAEHEQPSGPDLEIGQLKQRIAELEDRLRASEKPKRRPARKRAAPSRKAQKV